MSTDVTDSIASNQGGMLFILPRELRDMVYRYVLKGNYLVSGKPETMSSDLFSEKEFCGMGEHGASILRVAKAVSDEATKVLYSESRFRFDFPFREGETMRLPSREAFERMMDIELNMTLGTEVTFTDQGLPPGARLRHFENLRQNWRFVLCCINRTAHSRNKFRVRYRLYIWDTDDAMPTWPYRRLRLLTGFRTVTVEVLPALGGLIGDRLVPSATDSSDDTLNLLDSKTNDIKDYLANALGPAVVGHTYDPGHLLYAKTVEFHL